MSNLRCREVCPTKMINLIYACGDKVSKATPCLTCCCQVLAKKKFRKKWYTKNTRKNERKNCGKNTFVASRQGVNFLALTWGCPKKYATLFQQSSFFSLRSLLFWELGGGTITSTISWPCRFDSWSTVVVWPAGWLAGSGLICFNVSICWLFLLFCPLWDLNSGGVPFFLWGPPVICHRAPK